MRFVQGAVALVFLILGVCFSALNAGVVTIDFHFVSRDASLGVALLCAALAGALAGGIAVVAGVVWPQSRRIRQLERRWADQESTTATQSGQADP